MNSTSIEIGMFYPDGRRCIGFFLPQQPYKNRRIISYYAQDSHMVTDFLCGSIEVDVEITPMCTFAEGEVEDFHEWLKIQGYDPSCERHVTHMFSDGTCRYSIIKGNRWESNREANFHWNE